MLDPRGLNLIPSSMLASNPDLISSKPGVYMFFFDSGALFLEQSGYLDYSSDYPICEDGFDLLYVGATSDSLRVRARQHVTGNSRTSSLRMTVGAILAEDLLLESFGDESRTYFDFGDGERRLTEWICTNTRFAYHECDEPFAVERELLKAYPIPLNISERRRHPYSRYLMALRAVHAGRPHSWGRTRSLNATGTAETARSSGRERWQALIAR